MNSAQIASEALSRQEPERTVYLHETCAGDESLLREVEELILLRQELTSPELSSFSLQEIPAQRQSLPSDPLSETDLGDYHLLQPIARGGMGAVFMAIHRQLHQTVAIKVLHRHPGELPTAVERFFREAHAAAAIHHPNVIRIIELAPQHQPPYFVMPYIEGASLQQRLQQQGTLPVVEILRIGHDIALALAASHAAGLLHRDVKPANILLDETSGRAILSDFGLAYEVGDQRLTAQGMVAGTPLYMSPEQTRGDNLDARSDLFSLGALLYTLCAGRPPFRAASTEGVLRAICETTPTPLTELQPGLPESLVTLVEDLLQKDPNQRPASAEVVAQRLQECLTALGVNLSTVAEETPPAEPPSFYRLLFQAAGLVLVLGLAFLFFAYQLSDPLRGLEPSQAARSASNRVPLDGLHWDAIPLALREQVGDGQNPAALVVGILGNPVRRPVPPFTTAAYSPDGSIVVLATAQGKLWFTNPVNGAALGSPLLTQDAAIRCLAFRPDGQHLAGGGADRIVRIWHTETRDIVRAFTVPGEVVGLTYTTDANLLVLVDLPGTGSKLQLWDPQQNRQLRSVTVSTEIPGALVRSPRLSRLAVAGHKGLLQILDEATLQPVADLKAHPGDVRCAVFSHDGKKLYSGGADKTIRVWDVNTGEQLATCCTPGEINGLALLGIDPQGNILAAACDDGHLLVCQPETGQALRRIEEPGERLAFVVASPDRQTFALGGQRCSFSFHPIAQPEVPERFVGHVGPVLGVAFTSDEDRIVTLGMDQTLALWDAATGKPVSHQRVLNGGYHLLAVSPSGPQVVAGNQDGKLRMWDLNTLGSQRTWKGSGEYSIRSLTFSSDGKRIVSGDARGGVQIWDTEGQLVRSWKTGEHPVVSLNYTTSRDELLTVGWDKGLRRWQASVGKELPGLVDARQIFGPITTSGDGNLLAARSKSGNVYLYRRDEPEPAQHDTAAATHLAITRDGQRLLAHSANRGSLHLWDLTSHDGCGQEYRSPYLLGEPNRPMSLSPSGRFLALGRSDGLVLILRLARPGKLPSLSVRNCHRTAAG